MAAKDGAGPRPAAHRAKRCFLKCLETIELQPLLFPAVSSGPRTVSQHQNTMAAKDGSGPRPAAHRAKRCFLNCLEARASTLAFSCRQLGSKDGVAAPKHHGSEGRSGPAAGSPSCQTLLSEVPRNYSFNPCFFLPSARVQGRCRSTKTPWQRRTERARGRQPIVPNVAFWSA